VSADIGVIWQFFCERGVNAENKNRVAFLSFPILLAMGRASSTRSKPHAQIRHQVLPKTIHKKFSVPQRMNNPYATKPSLLCGDGKSKSRLSNCAAAPKKLR